MAIISGGQGPDTLNGTGGDDAVFGLAAMTCVNGSAGARCDGRRRRHSTR